MEEKYIELLLIGCLKVKKDKPLFINYNNLNKDFVEKLVEYAKSVGITDIYLDEEDSFLLKDKLSNIKEREISKEFSSSIWDEYAKKDACFLMLNTEVPHVFDEIDAKILAKYAYVKRSTKPIYSEKQLHGEIPWCIAVLPNKYWAKEIYQNEKDPLKCFWQDLAKICFLDKRNPINEWTNFLNKQNNLLKKLNDLKIKKLHFQNSLGTDIYITLNDKALWQSASSSDFIVNMPSYEVFTSPDYRYTEGIVYSSKPLIYNGKVIDNFNLEFKKGKVINISAFNGQDILKEIIEKEKNMNFLGEVALVNYDSPISNTSITFKSTLLDENAACHFALGEGFTECILNGNNLSKEELHKLGLNASKNHVDFMIGTKDLLVEAITDDLTITIMKNGNIII